MTLRQRRMANGLTLIEMLVALAVVAILLTFARASYQRFLKSAAIQTAGQVLLKDAEFMEKYYNQNGNYSLGGSWPLLPYRLAPESGTALYRIKLLPSFPEDANSYALVALPICGTLVAREGCICVDQDSNLNFGQNAACNNAGGLCPCAN